MFFLPLFFIFVVVNKCTIIDTFDDLKIISLNVRGIRDIIKRKAILLFIRQKNADIIFLQETHFIEEDVKFWKAQWGDQCYLSNGTNQSAGVAIFFNKFKGSILEYSISEEGRWIIAVIKLGNTTLITCNLYCYNNASLAEMMMTHLCSKIQHFQKKYLNSLVVIGGDYNDAPDETLDRIPTRTNVTSKFKSTGYTIDQLTVIDVWRFLNHNAKEYTWSNTNRTQCSRIDLWLMTTDCVQYVKEVCHVHVPFSDHRAIYLALGGQKENRYCRGYWKMNSNLLNDHTFCDMVQKIAQHIFNKKELNSIQKWEFFQFKIREMAMKSSKVNKSKMIKENQIMETLSVLLGKTNLDEEETVQLKLLKEELDRLYIDSARGAYVRSRSRWLEQGEKNTSYFFALQKRNQKRNNITAIKIDGNEIQNSDNVRMYVEQFYKDIYTSSAQPKAWDPFFQSIKDFIPIISEQHRIDLMIVIRILQKWRWE